jgi:hypothetical protein
MDKLIIFNCILLAIIFSGVFLLKKYIQKETTKNFILLLAALVTIVFHYSAFLYLCFTKGDTTEYLRHTPNLILPVYPCNVVMWGCLIYGLLKNKGSKFGRFLGDYLFWFGIFSTLVGMFANVDFINNPTFADYEVTKSIVAHATLLFNILLIFAFGHIWVDLPKNMLHIAISVVMMYVVGLYCNGIFEVLVSAEQAYSVNSMFILHSPFPAVPFLTYPTIAGCALVLYFILFSLLELFAYPGGSRWYSRTKSAKK